MKRYEQPYNSISTSGERMKSLVFIGSFIALYTLFHILYFFVSDPDLYRFYQNYIVSIGIKSITIVTPGEQVRGVGNVLVSDRAALEVVRGCDGAGVLFIMAAATLAFRCPLRQKLAGLFLGIALVYAMNLLRIIGLFYIVSYRPAWFLPVHTLYAPTFMIIVCCLYFIRWVHDSTASNKP